MQSLFGHSGGIEGVVTSHGSVVPSGPSAFAQAQSRFTSGQPATGPAMRRPTSLNLRGSLMRAEQADADWSATAGSSPAPGQQPLPIVSAMDAPVQGDTVDLSSPSDGVPLSQIMNAIHEAYDLNVVETDHLEWLITTGLLPTVGHVWDTCETLGFPRKTPATSPAPDASPPLEPRPPPRSWTQDVRFQSPLGKMHRPENTIFSLQAPAMSQSAMQLVTPSFQIRQCHAPTPQLQPPPLLPS